MALATRDPVLAKRLRIRAEQYLVEADISDGDPSADFARALDEFNDEQMRGH